MYESDSGKHPLDVEKIEHPNDALDAIQDPDAGLSEEEKARIVSTQLLSMTSQSSVLIFF